MDLDKRLKRRQTKLDNPDEKARILRQYAGIFPNNISEFASKVLKKHKLSKNFSR